MTVPQLVTPGARVSPLPPTLGWLPREGRPGEPRTGAETPAAQTGSVHGPDHQVSSTKELQGDRKPGGTIGPKETALGAAPTADGAVAGAAAGSRGGSQDRAWQPGSRGPRGVPTLLRRSPVAGVFNKGPSVPRRVWAWGGEAAGRGRSRCKTGCDSVTGEAWRRHGASQTLLPTCGGFANLHFRC